MDLYWSFKRRQVVDQKIKPPLSNHYSSVHLKGERWKSSRSSSSKIEYCRYAVYDLTRYLDIMRYFSIFLSNSGQGEGWIKPK